MQTLEHNPSAVRPSFLSTLRLSLAERGFLGLYTGLSASVLRQMSYSLVRIGSYEKMKATLGKDGKPSNLSLLAAASVAGAMGGVAGNPADVLLVRMTSDTVRPAEQRYNYSNAISGLVRLVKEEGAQALGRGLGTNVTRAILMNASQVGSYDFFKSSLLGYTLPGTEFTFRDNLVTHTLSSLAAGTFATTVCSPADVLRSRIMASTDHSLVHVLQKSLREEGARFLFKGWLPAFIRLGPNTVLLFVFFEQLKNGWRSLVE
ncbi:mitochondrial carrier domain-containing protein [Schizophyllum fasciatum]